MANLPPRPHLPHRRMGPAPLEGPAMISNCGSQIKHEEHEGHKAAKKSMSTAFFLGALSAFVFQMCTSLNAQGARPAVLVVVGAEGAKDYGEPFREWAGRWEKAAGQANAEYAAIGLTESPGKTDRD